MSDVELTEAERRLIGYLRHTMPAGDALADLATVKAAARAEGYRAGCSDRDRPTVCVAHGNFVPCRKPGEHRHSHNPYWVKCVRDYQSSPIKGLTWEPAWPRPREQASEQEG